MSDAENHIKTCTLGGGVTAEVVDATSHYFGGYYHVKIRISADVPVTPKSFDTDADFRDALNRLGSTVRFSRELEKMAVPEGEIATVRRQLLDSFDSNVLSYLSRDDFAASFVRSEYHRILKQTVPRFR